MEGVLSPGLASHPDHAAGARQMTMLLVVGARRRREGRGTRLRRGAARTPGPRSGLPTCSDASVRPDSVPAMEQVLVPVEVPLVGDERRKNWAKVVAAVDDTKASG